MKVGINVYKNYLFFKKRIPYQKRLIHLIRMFFKIWFRSCFDHEILFSLVISWNTLRCTKLLISIPWHILLYAIRKRRKHWIRNNFWHRFLMVLDVFRCPKDGLIIFIKCLTVGLSAFITISFKPPKILWTLN